MITPTVTEIPIAGTTHQPSMGRIAADVLERMIASLRARPCLRENELASLGLIEHELSERRLQACG